MIRKRIDLNNKGKLQNPQIQDMGGKTSKSAASGPIDAPFSVNLSEELMVTLSEVPAASSPKGPTISEWRAEHGASASRLDASIASLESSLNSTMSTTSERMNEIDYKLSLSPETSSRGELCGEVQEKLAQCMRGGGALDELKKLAGDLKKCVKEDHLRTAGLAQ
ncbi:hypothetical protein TrCOL_g13257 [Triparma columacea]|uniref:Uncharacterized protein n=1 Tax=Triparma columacea TaxID=722753 RepID=A0A9W7L4N4_9STRA|nr:hypothetical protein TrCOL_g13257 [Triparma columacea]